MTVIFILLNVSENEFVNSKESEESFSENEEKIHTVHAGRSKLGIKKSLTLFD